MQTVTPETESKSLDLSICVHHYTLRAPCPKGQEVASRGRLVGSPFFWSLNGSATPNRPV